MQIIEMRNKNTMWVSDNQALAIDRAITQRKPVKVNGATINTVDISGIWPEDIWYDMHPELKPVPVHESNLQLREAITEDNKGIHYEAFLKNMELLKNGNKPRYYAEGGEIHEEESFWFGQQRDDNTVKAHWVKQSVSKQKWNSFYSASPGYHILSDNGDKVIIAFTVVGEIPHHLEELNELETKKMERK